MLNHIPTPRAGRQLRGRARPRQVSGFTLIEILVTVLILSLGLLGVAGMQLRATTHEFESYQRGQALALARDMETRIRSSRGIVAGYVDNAVSSVDGSRYFGVNGADYTTAGLCTLGATALEKSKYEACQWGRALSGAADGSTAGTMVGARGCVMRVVPANAGAIADVYVVVVWQGTSPGSEPPVDSPAGECANAGATPAGFGAGLRRGVSVRVLMPDLQKGA